RYPEHSPAVLPCPAQPSTARLCPCVRLRRDCSRYSKLCGSLHQREQHSQSIVKLLAFLRTKSMPFLYSVLMNCLTCGLDAFRKFSEIELDKSSVVQLVPRGMGHSGLPSGGARKRWGNSGDTAGGTFCNLSKISIQWRLACSMRVNRRAFSRATEACPAIADA